MLKQILIFAVAAIVCSSIGMGAGFYAGWTKRGEREAVAQSALKDEHIKQLQAEKERGDKLSADLEAEKRNIKTVTIDVIKEVPKVTKVYVEKNGDAPKPIPDTVFTAGFVRVWDSALLPTGVSAAAGGLAGDAGESDFARAAIGQDDVLNNAVVNFSRYAECRAQLSKLIQWHRSRPN